ncbi:MAG: DNA recombination protein RmuC [Clostridia bacterium]|nr:DNA recombination protein RmuC [Clostridia bacterium]
MDRTIILIAILLLLGTVFLLLLVLMRLKDARLDGQNRQMRLEQLQNQVADDILDAMDAQRQDEWQHTSALQQTVSQWTQTQQASDDALQQRISQEMRRQDESLRGILEETRLQLGAMDARMHQLREENRHQLDEMRKTVDEKLTASLDRKLTESFEQVSKRLEAVYRGLGEMQTLASGVGDLKKVLTNVKTRGIWGEIQLGALLSQMLSPGQYDENVAVVPGSAERVEFALRLPGRDGSLTYLAIDSKFPQEAYLRLIQASEEGIPEKVQQERKVLRHAIQTEAKRIAGKYIVPPHTVDFAIMFLPVEGLYAEVLRDTELVEQLQREQRVVIAGPSTLLALLNALQMGFRTLAIEKRTGEVWQLLSEVKRDFGQFELLLGKTRQSIEQAAESIDRAFGRTRSIQKRIDSVEDLTLPALPEA